MSIPKPYKQFKSDHPELVGSYESMVGACASAGPLDAKTVALVKLACSISNGLEGAAHSHARKALEAGCSGEELEHVAIITAPTIGFPAMMRGRSWVRDVTEQ
jgi:4-carboxymuconolactone decarboxylase